MSSVEVHRRIKKALKKLENDSTFACHNVESIALMAKTDTRTTKKHLALLQEDGLGKFCDPKGKTYASFSKFTESFKDE